MGRDFVVENEEESDNEDSENPREAMRAKIKREMIEKLACEWNILHNRMEQKSFDSEAREAEDEYLGDCCDNYAHDKIAELLEKGEAGFSVEQNGDFFTNARRHEVPEEIRTAIRLLYSKFEEEFWANHKQKIDEDAMRLSVVEELLGQFGARMKRPYEHWNEEEKYMEYMETRYDNDDRD